MRTIMCFEADVRFIIGDGTERALDVLFTAPSEAKAVSDGVAWARNRESALGWRVAAVNVGKYFVEGVQDSGFCATGHREQLFDWKVGAAESLDTSMQRRTLCLKK